ncbi:hypothetical protein [Neotamlana sedimentorum]|uniref:hypothetical protein n=1 Tax=Neotamlana sedimentorum TaxID=1435349 RepID=UPI00103901F0|nr:hypothetical protein [Tamlana sedimentorum]
MSLTLSLHNLEAQTIHVLTYIENNTAVFETEVFQLYSNKLKNQSEAIKNQLQISHLKAKYADHSGFSSSFFNLVKSEKKENIFKAEKEIHFKLDYIIDETGENVLACAICFPKEQVFLSASEIQAVLEEAMLHRFTYINKPKGISNFYFTVTYSYNTLL